ncbi:MAG: hypothetical protein Kow0029_32350 [Candidatus Rifleibacteriota bacterium]
MLKKGFTLIELLIVITIIAILAGAAIPYVQDYVEDARISKVRADLDEIKNALIRYELDRGTAYTGTDTAALVGPYLSKALADPWGSPYVVSPQSSVVFSLGPDRSTDYSEGVGGTVAGTGDDLAVDYRPPLALSKAYYIDTNKNGLVDAGDQIRVKFTRELENPAALTDTDIESSAGSLDIASGAVVAGGTNKEAVITMGPAMVEFTPGQDTINIASTNANAVDTADTPYGPNHSNTNPTIIKSLQ